MGDRQRNLTSTLAARKRMLRRALCAALLLMAASPLRAQTAPGPSPDPTQQSPLFPSAPAPQGSLKPAILHGFITDTDGAAVPGARIVLENSADKSLQTTTADPTGEFTFATVAPGKYIVKVNANGFASWKVEDLIVDPGETVEVPYVALGVESINASVSAIFSEDLAEIQITAEEHQRILGILPNFFVSYLPNAQPLTRRQKFKLAFVVSTDPLTFGTTAITAGIEQAEGDFAGYGPGFAGYASRYAAGYGDRLSGTFFGSAILPSLLHQDPRYFYNGHGTILHRALYAISTTVICKGDNGKWQPNYSNVFGNLGSGFLSSTYYPKSDRHSVQVTFDNTMIGIAEGSISTLFQEFILRHVTHGAPPVTP